MKILILPLVFVFSFLGNVITPINTAEIKKNGSAYEDLKVLDFEELETYLNTKDHTKTFVINFWATWCAPCVKELPYFEQLNANYSDKDVEVILISLDFPKQINTKLKAFLNKNHLKSEVIVLDDVDSNTWIPKVSRDWTGAIPATIIYNTSLTLFYERSFTYKELEKELKQFIK